MPVKGTQSVRRHFNRRCAVTLLGFDSRLNQKLNCHLAQLQFFLNNSVSLRHLILYKKNQENLQSSLKAGCGYKPDIRWLF